MVVMFFVVLVVKLMDGLVTPVRSMPERAKWIAAFMPPKYYIESMRGIYQMGVGIDGLGSQILCLALFGVFFNSLAIFTYKKRS